MSILQSVRTASTAVGQTGAIQYVIDIDQLQGQPSGALVDTLFEICCQS